MSERNMKKQRGLSMLGMLVGCVVIALVAVLGIKVFPDVQEYSAIIKNAKSVVTDPSTQGASVAEIRTKFDKRSVVDNISTIRGADLDISKEGNEVIISFAYVKKIPLYGPVSLTIDFEGSTAK